MRIRIDELVSGGDNRAVKKAFLKLDNDKSLLENPFDAILNISEKIIRGSIGEREVERNKPYINDLIETSDFISIASDDDKDGFLIPKSAFQTTDDLSLFRKLLNFFILEQDKT